MELSDDELPAFLAVLVAGKFRGDAVDGAIAASPIVAAIADRAAEALIEYYLLKYGNSHKADMLIWRNFRNHQDEWSFARQYAADKFCSGWSSWDEDKKRRLVDNLIAPFKLDEEDRAVFIQEFLGH